MPNIFQGFPTVPRLPWDDFYFNSWFESLDAFGIVKTGSAAATLGLSGVSLDTAATAHSLAQISKNVEYPLAQLLWSKKREFRTSLWVYFQTSAVGYLSLTTGGVGTSWGLGFKIQDGKLYAHAGDGTDETNVLIADYGPGEFNVVIRLKCIFNPPSSCQFYLDDVLVATITTTLPAGTDNALTALLLSIENLAKAASNSLYLATFSIWQEW